MQSKRSELLEGIANTSAGALSTTSCGVGGRHCIPRGSPRAAETHSLCGSGDWERPPALRRGVEEITPWTTTKSQHPKVLTEGWAVLARPELVPLRKCSTVAGAGPASQSPGAGAGLGMGSSFESSAWNCRKKPHELLLCFLNKVIA